MSRSYAWLATENGKRVGKVTKAKRLAAEPSAEAARLRRCLARIKKEAEERHANAEAAHKVLEAAFRATCDGDLIVARAVVREAMIEASWAGSFAGLIRSCELAEEGTLCA